MWCEAKEAARPAKGWALGASLVAHAAGVALLWTLPMALPRAGAPRRYTALELRVEPRPARAATPARPRHPVATPRRFEALPPSPRLLVAPVLAAPPEARSPVAPVAAPVVVAEAPKVPDRAAAPPPAAAPPRVGTFSEVNRAESRAAAAREVNTGSFERGEQAATAATSTAGVAASGFEAVSGAAAVTSQGGRGVTASGFGGATVAVGGGQRPGRVAPAASGFGGATVAVGGGERPGRVAATAAGFGAVGLAEAVAPRGPAARVARASFGEVVPAAAPERVAREVEREPLSRPLVILDKPRPAYTEEARRLQIEGQVLVEAEFPPSGLVRVLRVVERLGHGLDESAVAATRAIRFRAAERAGQPVTTVATVRIVFQLAY